MMLSRLATKVSNEWELDFYSRMRGMTKKLWELLVTDAQGTFQHVEAVPSNCVNSRDVSLRARVQRLIDVALKSEEDPLLSHADEEHDLDRTQRAARRSRAAARATYQLYDWIDERQAICPAMPAPPLPATDRGRRLAQHRRLARPARPARRRLARLLQRAHADRIDAMAGYRPFRPEAPRMFSNAARQAAGAAARDQWQLLTLPYAGPRSRRRVRRHRLRATAPAPASDLLGAGIRSLATARPRHRATAPPRDRATARAACPRSSPTSPPRSITQENIGFRSLCPLPPRRTDAESIVHGVVIFSRRSAAIAAWLTGVDLAFVSGRLSGAAPRGWPRHAVPPSPGSRAQQEQVAQLFEEGKERTSGLHFLSVQRDPKPTSPMGSGC